MYLYRMILVTGGTGLVGSHLLYNLVKSGNRVRALKREMSSLAQVRKVFSYYPDGADFFSRIEWVEGDVMDIYSLLDAMEGTEYVFHCAAKISFHRQEYREMIKVNQEGTANMVNAALERKIKKFCHVSSIAALGKTGNIITEETGWKNSPDNSMYAISKYGAEREVWRGIEEGMDAVIANPSVIIGAGDWDRGSPAIFTRAEKGLKYYTQGMTGFIDVRDVVACMLGLMRSGVKNQRFILSAENLSFREYISFINRSLGRPEPSVNATPFMLKTVCMLEWLRSSIRGKAPELTRGIAAAAINKKRYSNEKIKNALGYNFIPVRQSVQDTAALFLRDRSLPYGNLYRKSPAEESPRVQSAGFLINEHASLADKP